MFDLSASSGEEPEYRNGTTILNLRPSFMRPWSVDEVLHSFLYEYFGPTYFLDFSFK